VITFPNGTTLEEGVWCTARDGTRLATDVYRPGGGHGPAPVLLLRTPYGRAAAQSNDLNTYAHPTWFARRRYIVVVQDVRGCHGSEGTFDPVHNEYHDGYDAVEWCAGLSGSSGDVGMYGMSYGALTQFAAAALRPPSLRCLSPAFIAPRIKDMWQVESLPRTAFLVSWTADAAHDQAVRAGAGADADALARLAEDPAQLYGRMPLAECPEMALIARYLPFVRDWLTRPPEDDAFWQPVEPATPSVPALYISGWYDSWVRELIDAYHDHAANGQGEARLLVGPWGHVPWRAPLGCGGSAAGDEPTPEINHLLVEWFDRHLKGAEPTSWLRDDRAAWFDYGAGTWQAGTFGAGARAATFTLVSDGLAAVSPSGRLAHGDGDGGAAGSEHDTIVEDPLLPTRSVGGWSCCYDDVAPIGPADQARVEASGQVAVYTSDPMRGGAAVQGAATVTLDLVTETVPCTVIATLCLVRDGRSINVARGLWRARPPAHGEAVGWVEHHAEIRLSHAAIRLRDGDRVRVLLQGSSFPEFAVDPHVAGPPATVARHATRTARIVIRPAGSRLVLPVVGG
jgi:putative CocE/NonD family hydrolase